jgi:aryl-alcohol dehydrogenase-like predicted oxidoreductase
LEERTTLRTSTLGENGPDVGTIGLGCMRMTHARDPGSPDDATSTQVIHQGIEFGVTPIDAADAYGLYTNEDLFGRGLGGHRDRGTRVAKVGLVPGSSDVVRERDGRPEPERESMDASLRRLGADH